MSVDEVIQFNHKPFRVPSSKTGVVTVVHVYCIGPGRRSRFPQVDLKRYLLRSERETLGQVHTEYSQIHDPGNHVLGVRPC